jgi:hypothetical protein
MELRRVAAIVAFACSVLLLTSCLARRRVITRNKSTQTQTLLTADKETLLKLIENQARLIETLSATVDMVPSVGSVIKGKITEYKEFLAYIRFRKPADIRIIGLYPVVRNKAFDMASDGTGFRLYVPSKNQFITGSNEPGAVLSPNKLENLRPSFFLDALLIPPPTNKQTCLPTDFTDEDNAAYILHCLETDGNKGLRFVREVWFSRVNLHIVRQMTYDAGGVEILTDARYSDWKVFHGVAFPRVIDINRPQDEFGVVITLEKIEFNKPIENDQFVLEQPKGSVLQVLGTKPAAPPAPATDSSASRKKNTH